jgi:hypothetical protein
MTVAKSMTVTLCHCFNMQTAVTRFLLACFSFSGLANLCRKKHGDMFVQEEGEALEEGEEEEVEEGEHSTDGELDDVSINFINFLLSFAGWLQKLSGTL